MGGRGVSEEGVPVDVYNADGGGTFFLLPSAFPSNVAASGTPANGVRFFQFHLPFTFLLKSVSFRVSAASAGNFAAVGIYNQAGTSLLADSGPVSTATTGAKTVTFGAPILMVSEPYLLAWTLSSGTPDIMAIAPAANLFAVLNASVSRLGTAANASVAGQLPATLGVLTGADVNVAVCKLGTV